MRLRLQWEKLPHQITELRGVKRLRAEGDTEAGCAGSQRTRTGRWRGASLSTSGVHLDHPLLLRPAGAPASALEQHPSPRPA